MNSRSGSVGLICACAALVLAATSLAVTLESRANLRSISEKLGTVRASLSAASEEADRQASAISTLDAQSLDISGVVEQARPAVFTVMTSRSIGTGFGFVDDGSRTLIVTNFHVIADALRKGTGIVSIVQGDSRRTGTVLEWDEVRDVALVEVNAELPVLESAFANGHDPRVGDRVIAYGSPEGLANTATVGVVSAIRPGFGWFQTDAQINDGNSGGPLLNRYGEVIGVTSLGFAGGGSGLGVAIDVRELCALPSAAC